MTLASMFRNVWSRKPEQKPKRGLYCRKCARRIRKHELYRVIEAEHKDCNCPTGGNVPKNLIDLIEEK